MSRIPNTECDRCGKPIYRQPYFLKKNKGKFCSRGCRNKAHPHTGKRATSPKMVGEGNPAWRGGNYIEPEKGYRMVRQPKHPRARANGYVLEHILVAEEMLGRSLEEGEEIHHINRDRMDNRPENLQIFTSHKKHWMTEHYETVAAARDAANSRKGSGDSQRH
jgi:hypothetical protein